MHQFHVLQLLKPGRDAAHTFPLNTRRSLIKAVSCKVAGWSEYLADVSWNTRLKRSKQESKISSSLSLQDFWNNTCLIIRRCHVSQQPEEGDVLMSFMHIDHIHTHTHTRCLLAVCVSRKVLSLTLPLLSIRAGCLTSSAASPRWRPGGFCLGNVAAHTALMVVRSDRHCCHIYTVWTTNTCCTIPLAIFAKRNNSSCCF